MLGAGAHERPGHRELLADRIRFRGVDLDAKVVAEREAQLAIAATADQDVFRLAVETRQLAENVADVGADAEIVQFPGINRDAHALDHSPS